MTNDNEKTRPTFDTTAEEISYRPRHPEAFPLCMEGAQQVSEQEAYFGWLDDWAKQEQHTPPPPLYWYCTDMLHVRWMMDRGNEIAVCALKNALRVGYQPLDDHDLAVLRSTYAVMSFDVLLDRIICDIPVFAYQIFRGAFDETFMAKLEELRHDAAPSPAADNPLNDIAQLIQQLAENGTVNVTIETDSAPPVDHVRFQSQDIDIVIPTTGKPPVI